MKNNNLPLASYLTKFCLSCRFVSVSCECWFSLKYLIIFGTKLDRTKKSPHQLFLPTFLRPLLLNLAFIISTKKIKNTCFLCLQFNIFVQTPGVQRFGYCYPADKSQSIGQELPGDLLIYPVYSATKLLTTGTTGLVRSILGEFQSSSQPLVFYSAI